VQWGIFRQPIEPEHFNFAHTKENQIRWLGLYGLRRSAASLLWSLTGDTQASPLLLRHSSPQTTTKHSLTFDRSKITSGLKLLEAHVTKSKDQLFLAAFTKPFRRADSDL
jgi:hypothetical protein